MYLGLVELLGNFVKNAFVPLIEKNKLRTCVLHLKTIATSQVQKQRFHRVTLIFSLEQQNSYIL